jgi:hypothetical protein
VKPNTIPLWHIIECRRKLKFMYFCAMGSEKICSAGESVLGSRTSHGPDARLTDCETCPYDALKRTIFVFVILKSKDIGQKDQIFDTSSIPSKSVVHQSVYLLAFARYRVPGWLEPINPIE